MTLRVGELAAGEYELRATVSGPDGVHVVGRAARLPLAWPARPRWKDAPGAKVLNNLVTELLSAASPEGAKPLEFTCPREGWVFVTSTAGKGLAGPAEITLDGQPLYAHQAPGTLEAMRYLAKGPHQLRAGGAGLERVVVRAIPELIFSKFGADPQVEEYGRYDWAFLSRHVLPNVNVLVATGAKEQEPHLRAWKRQGKRVLLECGVPGLGGPEPVTAESAWKYWSAAAGMSDPLYDGVLADEFWGGLPEEKLAAWTGALRRIRGDARFQGKVFYPYCGPMYGTEPGRRFLGEVAGAGWRFAFERYLPEQRDGRTARAYLDASLRQAIASWRREMPGAESRMIVCLGTFSRAAGEPRRGPGRQPQGVPGHAAQPAGQPPGLLRPLRRDDLPLQLHRRGDRALDGPAVPPLLHRGALRAARARPLRAAALAERRLRERPAGMDGLGGRAGQRRGPHPPRLQLAPGPLSADQPRQHRAVDEAQPARPNAVSQTLKSLQPGRLYTLRFFSGDWHDPSVKQKHAISVELAGTELVHEKSFQHVFANCYSHHHGPFDAQHRAWMNYRWLVFRAKGAEATLKISDWAGPTTPGGPAGQELMINFVQVQPYDERPR